MARRIVIPRQLRSSPAKLVLLLVVLALFLIPWRSGRGASLSKDALSELWALPRDEVAQRYEQERRKELQRMGYDAKQAARKTRTPLTLPDGSPSLSDDVDAYVDRLGKFVSSAFRSSGSLAQLEDAVARIKRHAPPQSADLPKLLFSTDMLGEAGVADLFRLWNALLPIPLAQPLADLLPETEWAEPARSGGPWKSVVADDGQIDAQASQWLGENVSGKTAWAATWRKLNFGVLRADFYRYMAMLFEGGIYADSDTAPISHPYVWGIDAKSILHPNLEIIEQLLQNHERGIDTTRGRVWERRGVNVTEVDSEAESAQLGSEEGEQRVLQAGSKSTPEQAPERQATGQLVEPSAQSLPPLPPPSNATHAGPVYPGTHRHSKRVPFFAETIPPDDATTLLSPDINIVVAIEWDSSIAWDWRRWMQWGGGRWGRSLKVGGDGRSLQFSQYVLAAKPFHPIFIDTVATIIELLGPDNKAAATKKAIDLTGPGPYSDAVFRYLLVRYGVTPDQLRRINGPVKVGDVLILQEEALLAPEIAINQMLMYVRSFFPNLPGSGVAEQVEGASMWYWGTGYRSWRSGGVQVVFHGLSGRWKAQGWNDP